MITEKIHYSSEHYPPFGYYNDAYHDGKGIWGVDGSISKRTTEHYYGGTPDTYTGKIDSDGNVTLTKHSGSGPSRSETTTYSCTLKRTFKNSKHQCNVHLDEFYQSNLYSFKEIINLPSKIRKDSAIISITDHDKRRKFAKLIRDFKLYNYLKNFFFIGGIILLILGIPLTASAIFTLSKRLIQTGLLFPEGTSTANIVVNSLLLVLRVLFIVVGAFAFYIGISFKKGIGKCKKLRKKCENALSSLKFEKY